MKRLNRSAPRHTLADDHSSTQQLISAIETKDKRFRLAQAAFMVGTFIILIIIISTQQRTLEAVQTQLEQQKINSEAATKREAATAARIERRLDCMVVFFSQKDRAQLSIDNIDKCTINRDGNIQQFFQNDDIGTSSVKPQTNSTPVAPTTSTPPPTTNTPPQNQAQAVQPTEDPQQGALGLNLCVGRLCL